MKSMWSLLGIFAFAPSAMATSPAAFHLETMTTFDGQAVVDRDVLNAAFEDLTSDLSGILAAPLQFPAKTLGSNGFDVAVGTSFAIITDTDDTTISHWERATGTADYNTILYAPSITARKGLPLSMEVGTTASWLGGGSTGTFGGFFRVAAVEGYKPWPDLTFHVGYNGLIGHPELELGVLTTGVTLGSSYPFGSVSGIRQGQVSPWLEFSFLNHFTQVRLSEDTKEALFGPPTDTEGSTDSRGKTSNYLTPRLSGGIQITNGTILFRLAGAWSPNTVPSITVAMGFSY